MNTDHSGPREPKGVALVTGGAGFIGTAVVPGLLRRFSRVVVLDNLHPQVHPASTRPSTLDPRAELIIDDITNETAWAKALQGGSPDVVIHLAAETGTGQSLTEASRHGLVNVVGTTRMLDALYRLPQLPRRIVLTSSRAVYGEGAWMDKATRSVLSPGQRPSSMLTEGIWDFPNAEPLPMTAESVTPAPVSVYGATKLAQEHLIGAWAKATGVEAQILRLQNVYGPGQSLTNPYTGVITQFCMMARNGQAIPVYEDGAIRRDLVYIEDTARAVLAAVDVAEPSAHPVDIGSGGYLTLFDIAQTVSRHFGAPEPVVTGQYRLGDVRHAWADTTRAATTLRWRPRVVLDEGIRHLARWIDQVVSAP